MNNRDAYLLRENTGTSGVLETARKAASHLAHFDIPHLIVGGIAVQEHGYPRVTIDVDIVVPDIIEASEFLISDLSWPVKRFEGCVDRLEDQGNGVYIDLLTGGKVLKRGCKVPFPVPTRVADELEIISLEQLIALKLDSWNSSPNRRHKDKTDVIELISRRKLPRDLAVVEAVRSLYLDTWDALQAET